MSPQLVTALIRSLYGGVLLGAASALTAWQTGRGDAYQSEDTVMAFFVTLVGYLIFRGAAEGLIDQTRAVAVRALKRPQRRGARQAVGQCSPGRRLEATEGRQEHRPEGSASLGPFRL